MTYKTQQLKLAELISNLHVKMSVSFWSCWASLAATSSTGRSLRGSFTAGSLDWTSPVTWTFLRSWQSLHSSEEKTHTHTQWWCNYIMWHLLKFECGINIITIMIIIIKINRPPWGNNKEKKNKTILVTQPHPNTEAFRGKKISTFSCSIIFRLTLFLSFFFQKFAKLHGAIVPICADVKPSLWVETLMFEGVDLNIFVWS